MTYYCPMNGSFVIFFCTIDSCDSGEIQHIRDSCQAQIVLNFSDHHDKFASAVPAECGSDVRSKELPCTVHCFLLCTILVCTNACVVQVAGALSHLSED